MINQLLDLGEYASDFLGELEPPGKPSKRFGGGFLQVDGAVTEPGSLVGHAKAFSVQGRQFPDGFLTASQDPLLSVGQEPPLEPVE